MNARSVTDALLRDFLLQRCSGSERETIERLFFVSYATRERLIFAEEDLIDAYLDGELGDADCEAFLAVYGNSVRLKLFAFLRRYARVRAGPT